MGDGDSGRIDSCESLENKLLFLLALSLELCVSTTTTGKTVKMLSHEGSFLTSRTFSAVSSDCPRLVNLVHLMSHL